MDEIMGYEILVGYDVDSDGELFQTTPIDLIPSHVKRDLILESWRSRAIAVERSYAQYLLKMGWIEGEVKKVKSLLSFGLIDRDQALEQIINAIEIPLDQFPQNLPQGDEF